jgi:hypothetical protein
MYESIPKNEEFMMDLILRNLKVIRDDNEFIADIGINFEEINTNNAKDFYLKSSIEDIGDLSVFSGYDDIDLSGFTIEPGKTKLETFNSYDELKSINPVQLYSEGFTNVILNDEIATEGFSSLPFNIILNRSTLKENKIKTEEPANFIIKKNNQVKFVVVNGFLIDISKLDSWNGNSIIYKSN